MKNILYIGNFDFVQMNAQAQLVYGNGLILRDLGHSVSFIGSRRESNNTQDEMYFDSFQVQHYTFNKSSRELINSKKSNNRLLEMINKHEDIDIIITYGTPVFSNFLFKLKKFARKKDIKLISNCVDLPMTSHGSIPERFLKTMHVELKNYFYRSKSDGLIAVSSYIEKVLNKRQVPSVIIPPLKNISKEFIRAKNKIGVVKLSYAGVPFPLDGRNISVSSYKDRIDVVIDLISTYYISKPKRKIRLDIYGLTEQEYLRVIPKHEKTISQLKEVVYFWGKISHDEVINNTRNSDYTILYRDENRMTKAGFSTKIVESVSLGIPVITTNVGDVSKYLSEGESIHYLSSMNFDQTFKDFAKIMNNHSFGADDINRKIYDLRIFDFRKYTNEMKRLIEEIGD